MVSSALSNAHVMPIPPSGRITQIREASQNRRASRKSPCYEKLFMPPDSFKNHSSEGQTDHLEQSSNFIFSIKQTGKGDLS